jgi:hypothetical protein
MKEEWLFPNAVVPVDVETTAALVAEIHRLIDVVGGLVLKQALAAPDCKETGVCIQTGLACFGQSAQPAPVQATMKLESSGPGYGPAPKQKLSVRHVSLIDEGKTSAQPAPVQEPVAHRQTGWAAHRDQYAVPVLFNPYTGQPRDVRDVQSDPQGILIVPPGKVEMLAAKPTVKQSLQVATSPAAQPAPVQPVAILKGIDEYGPVVDWYRHWVTTPIGTKFYTTPPAAPVVQEPHKGLSEHLAQVTKGRVRIDPVTGDVGIGTPAAQPAVPDAFGTREGEHPQYIQGWNDCRAEMLKGMK